MNKEIKKYIKYVKKIIPFYSKDKKEFLKLLTQKIMNFQILNLIVLIKISSMNLVVLMKLLDHILKV